MTIEEAAKQYLEKFNDEQREWVVAVLEGNDSLGDCLMLKLKAETPEKIISEIPKSKHYPVHKFLEAPQKIECRMSLEDEKALDEIAKAKLKKMAKTSIAESLTLVR